MVVALLAIGAIALAHRAHEKHQAKKDAKREHATATELPTSRSSLDLSTGDEDESKLPAYQRYEKEQVYAYSPATVGMMRM